MLSPYVAQLIAEERIAERQRYAASARLAAIARCCRPSAWTRTADRISQAAARLRRPRPVTAQCCAAA